MEASNLSDPGSPTNLTRFACNLYNPRGIDEGHQEKVMANLKDIVATLAILSAGTLTLTGCKKEGETANPDEVKAGESAGAEGEGSCKGEGGCEGDKTDAGAEEPAEEPAEEAPAEDAPAEEAPAL